MSHPVFHFGVGLAIGTAAVFPGALRRLGAADKLAVPLAKRMMLAYAFGAFALVPGFLGLLGVPAEIRSGWWANIFFLHPFFNRAKPGGMLIGEFLCGACFALQYALLLAAIRMRPAGRAEGRK